MLKKRRNILEKMVPLLSMAPVGMPGRLSEDHFQAGECPFLLGKAWRKAEVELQGREWSQTRHRGPDPLS